MLGTMLIRDAAPDDWPAIWAFQRHIIAAGDTFAWDPDLSEQEARAAWLHAPPGRTFVFVDADGKVVGTAEMQPNHGGPGSHIANAGFMVAPERFGLGIGRALCEHVIEQARADGYRGIVFNAVAETNTRAVGLYRSLGFVVLATVPEGFHHPAKGYVGLHIMHRRL
jgi:ribosomal protein S18 acetylase RimI-like enzyme